ncbi:glycine zipper 2TM domain-containing protein [Sphingomonas sp.]|uniref:glycine zipper 2TM domain-containing protein n=1 Tax=Sphingomonas sp. TaxID=28214 RepID=UPI0025D72D98|nr:glycine zipper 2TM domain-containing protein [Sphingomonas sp.]
MTAAVMIPALPAMAQTPRQDYNRNVRDAQRECARDLRNADNAREYRREQQDCRDDVRDAQRQYNRDRRDWNRDRRDWRSYRYYDWNRGANGGAYYADDFYRDGRYYSERRLTRNDRIYRGRDGRYYCRRSDGTTGLIVGGVAGGLFGNALSNGRNATIGTLLGAALGASVGSAIDRGNVRCR